MDNYRWPDNGPGCYKSIVVSRFSINRFLYITYCSPDHAKIPAEEYIRRTYLRIDVCCFPYQTKNCEALKRQRTHEHLVQRFFNFRILSVKRRPTRCRKKDIQLIGLLKYALNMLYCGEIVKGI